MPSVGGARFAGRGSEVAADVRDSVRVVRRAGKVGVAAMMCIVLGRWKNFSRGFGWMDDFRCGSSSRLGKTASVH